MALFKDLAQEEMGSWTVSKPGTVSYFIMNLNKYKEKKIPNEHFTQQKKSSNF